MKFSHILYLSCKRVTFLLSKQEEGKLSFLNSLRLKWHLHICDGCNNFKMQTNFFSANAKQLHRNTKTLLTTEQKEKMKSRLKEEK